MGLIKPYPPVKLISAITITDLALWPVCQEKLEKLYSPIDRAMEWYEFHHTDYYLPEMGSNLKKRMVSFGKLIRAEDLPGIKLAANELEQDFSRAGKRQINIDPGYICVAKLVLATTKDFSHRIYLDSGIFADLHLKFQKGHFRPQEWTYPDYREAEVLRFFEEVREAYLAQLAVSTTNCTNFTNDDK